MSILLLPFKLFIIPAKFLLGFIGVFIMALFISCGLIAITAEMGTASAVIGMLSFVFCFCAAYD